MWSRVVVVTRESSSEMGISVTPFETLSPAEGVWRQLTLTSACPIVIIIAATVTVGSRRRRL